MVPLVLCCMEWHLWSGTSRNRAISAMFTYSAIVTKLRLLDIDNLPAALYKRCLPKPPFYRVTQLTTKH